MMFDTASEHLRIVRTLRRLKIARMKPLIKNGLSVEQASRQVEADHMPAAVRLFYIREVTRILGQFP